MADAEGDHEEYVRAVQYNNDWFRVRPVDAEEVWSGKWQKDAAQVTYRTGGTTGTVEVEGELRRVHVCAHFPCTKVHRASKQKVGVLPPRHVRLVDLHGDGGGHELAVAGVALSSDDTPPVLPPPADSPGPPATASDPSEDETDDDETVPGDPFADEDEEIHTWHDKTALAPAPSLIFCPGKLARM